LYEKKKKIAKITCLINCPIWRMSPAKRGVKRGKKSGHVKGEKDRIVRVRLER